ncbi:MATE family efflux transporter [Tessaracoccus defluvii]|uniref:Probable multidrug resistance protein NorM n=1 Tax=Tessaracoccus defluvii TaxID=1285901 RepID=A0A7H0H221_9ACTN|nr:MATE family efflux transporter [Tessaracoccus defluvii]QNP54587.1 MATE family efflux transporter [Tessaracoccus defluvii]
MNNLTVGAPTRVIVAFTIPLLIGNLFQQVYQFTDAAVVGRMIGVDALASVGATGSLMFLLLGFTFGASGGLAIPIARAFGAGDMALMRRYFANAILVSVGIAALVAAVGVVGARSLLRLMQTPSNLMADAEVFLVISFWGAPIVMAYNLLAAVIRALGDSRTPLYFLMISCVINVVLVVAFIGGLGWGVAGAALATVLAQLISVILCLALIARRMPHLHLTRADWRSAPGELGEVLRPGLAMGFQMSVIAIGAVILQYAINGLGSDAVAAFTAAARVDQLAVAPLASFGLALTTFVAQNRGAGRWHRIRHGVWRISLLTWILAVILGAFVILAGEPLAQLFVGSGSPQVVEAAHGYLVVQGLLYPILASVFVLRNTVQGLGETLIPTIGGFMELILRAAAGLLLVVPLGFFGVALAAPLAWIGALIPVAICWFGWRRAMFGLADGADEPLRAGRLRVARAS